MSKISLILESLYEIRKDKDHFAVYRDNKLVSTADTESEAEEDIKQYEEDDKRSQSTAKREVQNTKKDQKSYSYKTLRNAPDGIYYTYCYPQKWNSENTRYFRDKNDALVSANNSTSGISGKKLVQIKVKDGKLS